MKNNQVTFALVSVLFLSTLITAGLLFFYNRNLRNLADVQFKAQQVQVNVNRISSSMLTDAVEYSKKNPAIDPLLKKFGVNVPPTPAK
jgi:hypothetical protein